MAIQIEDVVDCLCVLRPQFDFLLMFDHSRGNARKRDGALDAQICTDYATKFWRQATKNAFIRDNTQLPRAF